MYGSETGNSEAISHRIHMDALEKGYDSKWICFKDFQKVLCFSLVVFLSQTSEYSTLLSHLQENLTTSWPTDGLSVIVVSSTGAGLTYLATFLSHIFSGDPPESITRFWRAFKRMEDDKKPLTNVKYALLGARLFRPIV